MFTGSYSELLTQNLIDAVQPIIYNNPVLVQTQNTLEPLNISSGFYIYTITSIETLDMSVDEPFEWTPETQSVLTRSPFTYLDSGSTFYVTDPVSETEKEFYVMSVPSASTTDYLWSGSGYPSPNKVTWATNLQKFLLAGAWDGTPTSSSIYVSENGITWESAITPITSQVRRIACSDTLNLCVGSLAENTTHSIVYSTDGYIWSYVTSSVPLNVYEIAWSPSSSKFVGVGVSGSVPRNITVTSSNGIDWAIFANKPTGSGFFECITWHSASAKFVSPGYSVPLNSSSILTSIDGETWQTESIINIGTQWKVIKSIENKLIVGGFSGVTNSPLSRSIMTTSDVELQLWNVRRVPMWQVYDIDASPDMYVAVGKSLNDQNNPIFLTSSTAVKWTRGNLPRTRTYDTASNTTATVSWSDTLKRFVMLGGKETYYSSNGYQWFRKTEAKNAFVGFAIPDTSSLSDTELTPWSGSVPAFLEEIADTTIEFRLARGPANPNDNTPDTLYPPTASYGIIIDSASVSQFTGSYSPFVEDFIFDEGILGKQRFLRELDDTADGIHYGYYETYMPTRVLPTSIAVFSGSFKAYGRNYVDMYYGVRGTVLNDTVGLIANLQDGVIEYYEDASNRNSVGSYNMSSGNNYLTFITPPSLSPKENSYWELTFKVGFRLDIQRSGSVSIT